MRVLRLTLYFVVGFVLSAFVTLSYAESIPATYDYGTHAISWKFGTGLTYTGDSCAAAAAARQAAASAGDVWSCGAYSSGSLPSVAHMAMRNGNPNYSYIYTVCLAPYSTWDDATQMCRTGAKVYSCPVGQNWTLSGADCMRPDCADTEERDAAGVCIPKCDIGQIRAENGTCRPYCWGAQFYDEASNTCRCSTQFSQTSSWTVTAANAKAGKLDPPSCVNGCEQGPDPILGFIGSFCPGGLVSMVTGGNTTCYGKIIQTGAICAPDVSAPAGSLMPVTVSPAPAGTGPSGTADPYSTTANNGDPTSCAAAGGNWGVFNGQGNCYTPTTADPMVTQKSDQSVVTNADGSKQISTTTTTNTCTGAGSCTSTSSTTTNNTTNTGGSSSTSVTVNNGSGTATGTVTKTAEGQYKIDLPKDYQKDSTGLILNSMVSEIKDAFGRPTGDDALITGAKVSDEAMGKLRDADKLFGDGVSGQSLPGVDDKVSLWEQTMREGWWEPISVAGCSPFSHTFNFFSTSYTWTLDHCPTAAKISEIGAYCMWILLLFSGFRMLTTPRGEM